MAMNFPDSPSNGDAYTAPSGENFIYNTAKGRWASQPNSLLTVPSSIIPDTDSAYDLGSATHKFRSLYLSSDTLYLGDSASISAGSGGEIILPSLKIGKGANAVRLEADASGKLKTKKVVGGVTQAAEEPGNATVVTDMAGLIALTGMSTGQIALVTALNKVFMYTGSAWYLIATMTNGSPTDITGVNSTYSLATDGTATTITAVSTDPEGFALTWSYAVTTGSLGSTATVSQADNVFTITPSSTEADAGTFSITFSVTDGATGAVNAVSAFTLVFPAPASSVLFTSDGSRGEDATTGTYTTHSWTVPNGVTSIAGVVIGSGAGASQRKPTSSYSAAGEAGGGGALSYVNNISVTPGETLTILVGNKGARTTSSGAAITGAAGGISAIRRGSTNLVSVTAAIGGADIINGNNISPYSYGGRSQGGTVQVGTGGSGGHGGRPSFQGWGTGGGGAGGYSGNGGDGYGGDRPSGGDQGVNPSNDGWGLSGAGGGGAGGSAEVLEQRT